MLRKLSMTPPPFRLRNIKFQNFLLPDYVFYA